ncbi:hypothetical protein EMCRGX_G034558, partial [Ephydatia muelleri]
SRKNWSNDEGNNALHLAALAGSPACISLALDIGVPITCNNKQDGFLDIIIDRVDSESALAVIQHDRWNECLQFKSPLHPYPMVGLIEKLPDVAKAVLDRCHAKSLLPPDHLDYWESYNFTHLRIDGHVNQPPVTPNVEANNPRDAKELYHRAVLMIDQTGLNSDNPQKEQPYIVLEKMVMLKRGTLLNHPIVTAYIKQKWKSYGRFVFLTALLIAFLQALFFSIFLSTVQLDHTRAENTTDHSKDGALDLFAITFLFTTLRVIWVVLNILLCGLEAFNISKNLSLWIGGASVITSYIFIFSAAVRGYDSNLWTAGALAVFFGWFGVALELSLFDLFGIYVIMFLHVTRTLFLVLSLCSLFLLAFGLAFYIPASGDPNFSTIGYSLFTVSSYLLGQINYEQFLEDEQDGVLSNGPVVFMLVALAAVILAIAIKNLLIGLAVRDIGRIQQLALVHRHSSHISTFTHLERAMPQCLKYKFNFVDLKVYPNKKASFLQQMWRYCWRAIKNENPEDEGSASEGTVHKKTMLSEENLSKLEKQLEDLTARDKRILELIEQLY